MSTPVIGYSLRDREVYNGMPASAAQARRIQNWQLWAREHWGAGGTPMDWGYHSNSTMPSGGSMSFYVAPPPLGFTWRRLKFWFSARAMSGSTTATIRSARTGGVLAQVTVPVPINEGWGSGYLYVDTPDTITVTCTCTGADYIGSFSAWWDVESDLPAGVTFDPTLGFISQAHVSADAADSAYVLRWLARKATQLMVHRPPMVVAAVDPASGGRRVMLPISPRTPSLTVRALASGGAPIADLYYHEPGYGQGTQYSGVDDGSGWHTITVPIQGHPHTTPVRAALRIFYASSWHVYETEPTAADLGLAGESIPSSFVEPVPLLSGAPILADLNAAGGAGMGRAALVRNMVWLMARKTRTLVCASARLSGSPQRIYRGRTPNDGITRRVLIRGRIGPGVGYPGTNQTFEWQWLPGGSGSNWVSLGLAPPAPAVALEAKEAGELAPDTEWLVRRRWVNPDAQPLSAENTYNASFEARPVVPT